MRNFRLIKILFLAILLFLTNFSISNASMQTGIDVNLSVGGCNNNGVCEPSQGEDLFSCPLDCTPVVAPPGSGGSGYVMDNVFNNLTVEVSYNTATIKWKSVIPTMSSLKWGTSQDYKDGVLKNINFLIDHKVEITDLKDGTVYYFSIQATSLLGKTNSLENQVFRTLSLLDTTPPGNPTDVHAISNSSGITVSWVNPTDSDFDYIHVMRNDGRYYGSPFIGHLVYEGDGKYFTDSNVVACHKYFYSLFSRDRAGNYSSGSLINIIHNPLGSSSNCANEVVPPETLVALPNSFIITQGSSTYDFYPGNVFPLSGDDSINIKTNYSSTINDDDMWVEIRNKDGVIVGQYFFSRIRDKDGFINVVIPPFDEGGYYHVSVYKYNNGVDQMVNYGSFEITKVVTKTNVWSFWYTFWVIIFILIVLLILFLLFFIILPKIFKRFKKEKKELN